MSLLSFYIIHTIVLLLATGGCLLAIYIYDHKRQKKPLVCPMHGSCESVTEGKYSKFLGVSVEVFGMLYYGVVILLQLHTIIFPAVFTDALAIAMLILSIGALCFSIYLFSLQAFVIKHWCTWCLFSSAICVLIFAGSALLALSPGGLAF